MNRLLSCLLSLVAAPFIWAQSGILWHNPANGELSVWQPKNAVVESKSTLSWKCDTPSGCASSWRVIGAGRFDGDAAYDIAWYNTRTGEVSFWIQTAGTVTRKVTLDWKCPADCARDWQPVAVADFNLDGHADVLWHNATTGELSAWLLNGREAVLGKKALSWHCDLASGCARSWKVVGAADFDGNGQADLLWHNPADGQLSAWLLRQGEVTGKRSLDWKCDRASGCSTQWKPFGVGDSNRDGSPDVFWFNPGTGQVSAWLVDGFRILGKNDLDWKCTRESGCQRDWRLVAVI